MASASSMNRLSHIASEIIAVGRGARLPAGSCTQGTPAERDGTAAPLCLIVREDFALLYVAQRFGDFVSVDGGNKLGQLA